MIILTVAGCKKLETVLGIKQEKSVGRYQMQAVLSPGASRHTVFILDTKSGSVFEVAPFKLFPERMSVLIEEDN